MIRVAGRQYGTAQDIATALGGDVTVAMVRNWAQRDGLEHIRTTDDLGRPSVQYPLDQAATIEARKRLAGRGRRRRLDTHTLVA